MKTTVSRAFFPTIILLAALTIPAPARAADPAAPGRWSASGTLFEACTCSVPCSCNFGEPPSPHSYCYSVYAYRLDSARWNGVDLSGLVIAGADGPQGGEAFLDARATPAQRPALKALTRAVWAQGGPGGGAEMPFVSLAVTPVLAGNDVSLSIGNHGGFHARLIVGRDGKTPVVVENNTVWPVARAIKGKTTRPDLRDANVGAITGAGTNANVGAFSMAGETAGFGAAGAGKGRVGASCCGGGGGGAR